MSKWAKVGGWLKDNAGTGAKLIGSLVAGGTPAALAAGIAMISGATGTDDPDEALEQFKANPECLVKLKEIAAKREEATQNHIEEMHKANNQDKQAEHHETQETIRNGDNSHDRFVRWTRPGQSWCSLFAAFFYVGLAETVSAEIVLLLLALPWAYAGLRQAGKGITSVTSAIANYKQGKAQG